MLGVQGENLHAQVLYMYVCMYMYLCKKNLHDQVVSVSLQKTEPVCLRRRDE